MNKKITSQKKTFITCNTVRIFFAWIPSYDNILLGAWGLLWMLYVSVVFPLWLQMYSLFFDNSVLRRLLFTFLNAYRIVISSCLLSGRGHPHADSQWIPLVVMLIKGMLSIWLSSPEGRCMLEPCRKNIADTKTHCWLVIFIF